MRKMLVLTAILSFTGVAAIDKWQDTVEHFESNKDEILTEIRSSIDSSDYFTANAKMNQIPWFYNDPDAAILSTELKLHERIKDIRSSSDYHDEFMSSMMNNQSSEILCEINELDRQLFVLMPLKNQYENSYKSSLRLCFNKESEQLFELHRTYNDIALNKEYDLTEQFSKKADTQKHLADEALKVEQREKKVSKNFSFYNGSSASLVNYVKQSIENPESFEHVSTGYADKGDYIAVQMTYRHSNVLGGIVKNRVSARLDIDGNVLQVN